MATLAIVLGSALGLLSMRALAARGPLFGVPQMVLSRVGFGFAGNALPAGINALVAGVGWFAVNSVSGAFALNALLGWNSKICLLIIVVVQLAVAFFGYNLVHAFERWAFPVLVVIFLIASAVIVSSRIRARTGPASRAISKYAANPTAGFTSHLPGWIADVTMLAIALGAICANALSVYSGSMSFLGARHPAATVAAPGHRRDRVRHRRVLPGPVRAQRRGHQVQQLPARHRLLDRPVAGRVLRRPVPARGRRVDGFLFMSRRIVSAAITSTNRE